MISKPGMAVGVFSRTTGCDLLDLPAAWARLEHVDQTTLLNCAALVGSINYVTDFAADVVDVNMRIILNTYKITGRNTRGGRSEPNRQLRLSGDHGPL